MERPIAKRVYQYHGVDIEALTRTELITALRGAMELIRTDALDDALEDEAGALTEALYQVHCAD